MNRYFIRLSYDGTNFFGWQTQKAQESVQETIEKALTTLCREKQAVLGCGRTDTGVHADDYYAHWDSDYLLEENFSLKLNALLPRSIAIKDIFPVNHTLNARYSATKRTYHYYIHTQKCPFKRLYSYEYPHHSLNIELMKEGASLMMNYSEFLPLIKLDKEHKKTKCTLFSSRFDQLDKYYFRYEISANRFLHNMVRRIVGTLILIGREKLSFEELKTSMDQQSPLRLIALAPSNGLHLVDIEYPELEKLKR